MKQVVKSISPKKFSNIDRSGITTFRPGPINWVENIATTPITQINTTPMETMTTERSLRLVFIAACITIEMWFISVPPLSRW
jgi:hypothetical protein